MFARIESRLDKLERREQSLIAKCELQEGRLSSLRMSEPAAGGGLGRSILRPRSVLGYEDEGGGDDEYGEGGEDGYEEGEASVEQGREQLRLKQMRQKKERLSYAVERLTLQVKQRERQLRMSVAAQ